MSGPVVALVQTELAWEDPAANHKRLATLLDDAAGADLVVLPEMFSTGFSMRSVECAEAEPGASLAFMVEQAARLSATLCGSVMTRDGDRYFNRLYWVSPDGRTERYDKRHLFRMSGEHEHYAAGGERHVFTLGAVRILPLVCYDLRFPAWSSGAADFDVVVYVANWPGRRRSHWQRLLAARAIENQAYAIGVNRTGSDGNGVTYSGDSAVYDWDGDAALELGSETRVATVTLDLAALQAWREAFPSWRDAASWRNRDA